MSINPKLCPLTISQILFQPLLGCWNGSAAARAIPARILDLAEKSLASHSGL